MASQLDTQRPGYLPARTADALLRALGRDILATIDGHELHRRLERLLEQAWAEAYGQGLDRGRSTGWEVGNRQGSTAYETLLDDLCARMDLAPKTAPARILECVAEGYEAYREKQMLAATGHPNAEALLNVGAHADPDGVVRYEEHVPDAESEPAAQH